MNKLKTVGYLPIVDGKVVATSKVSKNKGLAKIASNRIKKERDSKPKVQKKKSYRPRRKPTQQQLLERCANVLTRKFGS